MVLVLSGAAAILSTYTQPVTALARYRDGVLVGRKDGAVEQLNRDFQVETAISMPTGKPISFLAASTAGIAWLSGPGSVIRERTAAGKPNIQMLTMVVGDRTVTLSVQPASPVRRLAWLQGKVALCYDFGADFVDLKGKIVPPSTFMPSDVAALVPKSSLWIREQEDGTEFALFAKPHSVRQNVLNRSEPLVSLFTGYQVGAWQWEKVGGFASTAFDAFPEGELQANDEGRLSGDAKFIVLSDRVGLTEDGVVARESDSLVSAPLFAPNWESSRVSAATVPGDSLWFGASQDSAWWWNGSAIVQQNKRSGAAIAFVPWTDSRLKPTSFEADGDGLWVGSSKGLSYVASGKPCPGLIRVSLGAMPSVDDPSVKQVTDAAFAWRFADAEKAGADGGVMIASVFSVLGKHLPQTAAQLQTTGTPVTDEMKFGDVILTDKSAALYLGNGKTVEVRGGKVQNGEIWTFSKAVVRRFLD